MAPNQKKQFEFKYQGENFIDLNTLITSQFHFLAAVNEIQKELYPEIELKLRVGAFNQGSFVIDLLMESSWLDNLFNKENVTVLTEIVGGFASLVGIHKYLKGRKAKNIEEGPNDSVTISVDGENSPVTIDKRVFNIYTDNITVNKSIQQNFELLEKDNEIDGVEIVEQSEYQKNPILEINRDDFSALTSKNPYLSRETHDELRLNQSLFIKKANVMPEKNRIWKWEFIHKGRDISAKVTDMEFARAINEGLRIGQGDRLVADLKVGLKYSEQFATFIESNQFEVVKVHELKPRDEQSSLFS
jgi:hypothetical protein